VTRGSSNFGADATKKQAGAKRSQANILSASQRHAILLRDWKEDQNGLSFKLFREKLSSSANLSTMSSAATHRKCAWWWNFIDIHEDLEPVWVGESF
jgi:hypothetical protein